MLVGAALASLTTGDRRLATRFLVNAGALFVVCRGLPMIPYWLGLYHP